jgi:DNA polymerase III epsilon subunit-like protein
MNSVSKHHIRVLVIDTETTGKLPKHRFGDPFPPSEAYPYITQISWVLYNVELQHVEETFNAYINVPPEIEITQEITQITGITRDILNKKGQPIVPVLLALYRAYMKCSCIVAHNTSFDSQIIRQEIYRNREGILLKTGSREIVSEIRGLFTKAFHLQHEIEMYCTMMNSIELCAIEFAPTALQMLATVALAREGIEVLPKRPTPKKFPRLNELYQTLFHQPVPDNMHNSLVDVIVCLRCFLKLRGYPEMSERKMNMLLYHGFPVEKPSSRYLSF